MAHCSSARIAGFVASVAAVALANRGYLPAAAGPAGWPHYSGFRRHAGCHLRTHCSGSCPCCGDPAACQGTGVSLCELGAGGRGFLGVFARRRHRHGLWAEFGRIGDAARIKGRAQCPLAYLQVAVQAWNGVSPVAWTSPPSSGFRGSLQPTRIRSQQTFSQLLRCR